MEKKIEKLLALLEQMSEEEIEEVLSTYMKIIGVSDQ